jgi:UPF0716 protein FxsA
VRRVLLSIVLFGLIELILLIKAGQIFGTWVPITAVLASGAIGVALIRHQGVRTVRRIREAFGRGIVPAGEAGAGVAGVAAGLLFILPGFLSDLAGLLLLVPGVRRLAFGAIGARAGLSATGAYAVRVRPKRRNSPAPLIEGEAIEVTGEPPASQDERSPWRR